MLVLSFQLIFQYQLINDLVLHKHVFHTNIIAYCQQNRYGRLTICIDWFILKFHLYSEQKNGKKRILDFYRNFCRQNS